MLKQIMWLAAAVAILAALGSSTAQASFEASRWSMGGAELKEAGTIEGTGQLKLNATSGLGGVECHVVVHANLTMSSGAGAIDKFITSNCMTFGFLLTVCGTNVDETPTVPWAIHAQKEGAVKRILFTETNTHNTFKEKGVQCPNGGAISITGISASNPVFLSPDSSTAFTKFSFGGEVETTLGASKVEGTISLFGAGATPGGSGTYGIL